MVMGYAMRKYRMLVFSDPLKGGEKDYNDWYSGRHLADIVAMPGFTGAQRFKLQSVPLGRCANNYLAIYDMETDDPDAAVANMFSMRDTAAMPMSPAFDMASVNVYVFEVLADPVGPESP
jgi:hypothetical protein